MRLGDQRAHVAGGIGARAYFHFGDFHLQRSHHLVGGVLAHSHHQRNGHAAFAAGTIGRTHERGDGVGNVGVGHDHGVILCAPQCLNALAMLASGAIDVFGNGGGAHKTHGLHAGIGQQGVHSLLVAVDHVQHAGWQTGLQGQLGNEQGAAGVAFGRLQNEAVSTSHGHGPHPQRHHGRKVEGRDARSHAQCLVLAPAVNAGAHVAAVLALEQFGRIAGVLHVFNAALQLAQAVSQDLAVLVCDEFANGVSVGLQQLFQFAHHPCAFQWRGVAPGRESGFSAGNGGLHGGHIGQLHIQVGSPGGGVVNRLRAGAAVDALAVDQMSDGCHDLCS